MVIKYGYERVSTVHQNLDRQTTALKKIEGLPEENIFSDKMTGKTDERENYKALKIILLNLARVNSKKEEKDRDLIELYIEELDRLGRTKKIIRDELAWFNDNGIIVRIIEIPTTMIDISEENDWVLELVNRILIEVYTSQAEHELEKKEKRVREGIEEAKKAGKYKGRKPIEVDRVQFEGIYNRWKNGEFTAVKAMSLLGLKTNTFYKHVKQYEEEMRQKERSIA